MTARRVSTDAAHARRGPHAPASPPTCPRPLTAPLPRPSLQMRGLVLLSLAGALGNELTKAEFQAQVKDSGKNAFVKFLAPW